MCGVQGKMGYKASYDLAIDWWCDYLQFVMCNQTGNDPQEDLAKPGYRPNMKVEKFKKILIFLATFWKL